MAEHRFDGQVAIVTGGGSGLGRSHAEFLARLGAVVVINDVRDQPATSDPADGVTADEVAERLRAEGYDAEGEQGDLTDETYATGLIERTVERYGRIDILINNAGVTGAGSIFTETTADLQRSFAVNYWPTFWTMRAAVRHMRDQGYGRVVNTASGLGAFGAADRIGYVSTKAAVIGLTKAAALDVADLDVRVNALCPIAYTPMSRTTLAKQGAHDLKLLDTRLVTPVALFLAHSACSINGEVLSAGLGVWARIFSAKTEGTSSTSSNIDDVAAAMPLILDTERYRLMQASKDQFSLPPK